ncbi:histidine phosphatase family protein [Paratractidigestivibacter sp.]|uniref:histidine phosphatase family protein n=1 Tax=Paratractidigestivibacter sp. TaxID=2847316 RepID=UPI002ABE9BE0|nr:histidine phosphatase family protein [Paratractidigestivibacter sp.]
MIKTLRYMRHGQTVFNERGIWQGRADSPLSAMGIAQARATRAYFAGLPTPIDHVYCSPLGRVIQTLEEALPEIGKNYVVDPKLIEMSFGEVDGTPIAGEATDYERYDFSQIGGEREETAGERTCRALERIMNRTGNVNVLAVGHGGTGRYFYKRWRELSQVAFDEALPNCSVATYTYDTNTRTFSCIDIWIPKV